MLQVWVLAAASVSEWEGVMSVWGFWAVSQQLTKHCRAILCLQGLATS